MKQDLNTPARPGAFAKIIFALLRINSLALIANGLFMLVDPRKWFFMIPGVKFTGGFNQHFIRDIGIIQLFLGVAFVVGMLRPAVRLELWLPQRFGLSRMHYFILGSRSRYLWSINDSSRLPGVTLPALIGIAATVWACRPFRSPVSPSSPVPTALAQETTTSE